jgi:hypothetical protein
MSDGEDEQQEEQPEEFQNRAARRAAKHKKHAHGVAASQTAEQQHGRGTVAARKQQFGNRRTGG